MAFNPINIRLPVVKPEVLQTGFITHLIEAPKEEGDSYKNPSGCTKNT